MKEEVIKLTTKFTDGQQKTNRKKMSFKQSEKIRMENKIFGKGKRLWVATLKWTLKDMSGDFKKVIKSSIQRGCCFLWSIEANYFVYKGFCWCFNLERLLLIISQVKEAFHFKIAVNLERLIVWRQFNFKLIENLNQVTRLTRRGFYISN